MPGDDMETCCNSTMAHGNACIGRHSDGRRHARHNFKFDACIDKLQSLFATTTEHKRVAALQTCNGRTRHFNGKFDQELIDFGLFHLVVRRHIAHIHHLCFRIT